MPKPVIIKKEDKNKGKGKNQIILDKVLDQEVKKTLDLFDTYVDYQVSNGRMIKQKHFAAN